MKKEEKRAELLKKLQEERDAGSEYGKKKYRKKEYPTGEEINHIIRFWYGITEEQYKNIMSMLRQEWKMGKKTIAAMAATSAAIVSLLLMIIHSLNNR